MRRMVMMLSVAALMVALTASAALAANFNSRCGGRVLAFDYVNVTHDGAPPPGDSVPSGTIYEVNPYFFGPSPGLSHITQEMDRLAALNVKKLYVMPPYERGDCASMYCVGNYRNIDPELGTMQDFQALVDAAHARDMEVIMDFVPNHTAPDHPWTTQFPERYVKNPDGSLHRPWPDVVQLDWSRADVKSAMKDNVLFWTQNAGVDGFRMDCAEGLSDFSGAMDWYSDVNASADAIKPTFMLAEGNSPGLHQYGFDMIYSDRFTERFKALGQTATAADMRTWIAQDQQEFAPDELRMRYLTNHDYSYGQNGYTVAGLGGPAAYEAKLALTTLMGSAPMIYSGQESGNLEPLEHDNTVMEDPDYATSPYRALVSDLFGAHTDVAAINSGSYRDFTNSASTNVLSFGRSGADGSKAIYIANMSPAARNVTVDILAGYQTTYSPLSGSGTQTLGASHSVSLDAWGYVVLVKQ